MRLLGRLVAMSDAGEFAPDGRLSACAAPAALGEIGAPAAAAAPGEIGAAVRAPAVDAALVEIGAAVGAPAAAAAPGEIGAAVGAPAVDAALVESMLEVQALVARREPPRVIYQAVVDNAIRMLGGDSGSLRFRDLEDPNWTVAVAWQTSAGEGERWRHRAPITEGLSGRVIAANKPLMLDDYQAAQARSQLAPPETAAIIGVPLREQGRVIGSLVVGSTQQGRHWTPQESQLLLVYGEHIAAALAIVRAGTMVDQALTDSLTGLGNRRLLLDRMETELARAGDPVTLLFMDLDGFKLVNDSLGHSVGDELLQAVAERLRSCVRDCDVCARLGGDEFAVLPIGDTDGEAVAARIIDALARGFEIGPHEVFISVSVGIASGGEDADTLLRHADVAMYHAKRDATIRHARFLPSMHAALVSRLRIESQLRRALERGELELHYQPIYNLASGRLAAFEGLLRWRHPTLGLVSPLEFVPVAEQTGLIVEIGRWVLGEGAAQLSAWTRIARITVGVNVATRELAQADYPDAVRAVLDGSFAPENLVLEVTEREPLEDVPGVLEALHAIKRLGVRLALDDFGTGYSTLVNLSTLPIDIIKIAKPFVDLPGGNPQAAGLLAGIIGFGRHLGLETVAEGIERHDQRELLANLGCDLGQGYLLGRPVERAIATQMLLGTARMQHPFMPDLEGEIGAAGARARRSA